MELSELDGDAAVAYEDFLRAYTGSAVIGGSAVSGSTQPEQVMLILGLIYVRYVPRPERARALFTNAIPRLMDPQQRALAEGELARLGPPPSHS